MSESMMDIIIKHFKPVQMGECPYFHEKSENLLALPMPIVPNDIHANLIERGFRHSYFFLYKPICKECHLCIPMRISPEQFKPSKKQRHILNKNRDIAITIEPPLPTEEWFDIYKRYIAAQHPEGLETCSYVSLCRVFTPLYPSSKAIVYRLNDKIVGITVADFIPNRVLSSVYHFFDPDYAKRSIGVFSMLSEIMMCKKYDIPWFYPGFWIKGCKKMEYKTQYKPHQLMIDDKWIDGDQIDENSK